MRKRWPSKPFAAVGTGTTGRRHIFWTPRPDDGPHLLQAALPLAPGPLPGRRLGNMDASESRNNAKARGFKIRYPLLVTEGSHLGNAFYPKITKPTNSKDVP